MLLFDRDKSLAACRAWLHNRQDATVVGPGISMIYLPSVSTHRAIRALPLQPVFG
jgi:hypothetical protein